MEKKRFLGFCGKMSLGFLALAAAFTVGSGMSIAQQKVLKAVSYTTMSDKDASAVAYKMFIDRINERSKGQIRVEYLGGPEVIPPGEQMPALSKGVVQLLLTPGYHTAIVPEVDATLVMDITPSEQRKCGFYDLMVKLHKERLGVIPLARPDYGIPFYLYSTVKVEKLKDFDGLKFRSNANYDSLFKKLGIVPVAMPIGDVYTALERNLIVGYPLPAFITMVGLQDVTKYVVDHGFWSGGGQYIYVNQKTYESLPKHLQELMLDVSKGVERDIAPILAKFLKEERDKLTAAGVKFVKLTPPDGDNLVKIATDVKWADIVRKSPEYGPKMRDMLKNSR